MCDRVNLILFNKLFVYIPKRDSQDFPALLLDLLHRALLIVLDVLDVQLTMFEDVCIVCGKPLDDDRYAVQT